MARFRHKTAFVVATKDRRKDLTRMLESVRGQSHTPEQIVIVDSSCDPVHDVVKQFSDLNVRLIYHEKPSASAQRNAGINAVQTDIDLIGFFDDDIVLEPIALERMLTFWEAAPDDLGGCAFNMMGSSAPISRVKGSPLSRWLGLYSNKKYSVMPSGWQTRAGTVTETSFVQWVPTGASMWRRETFDYFAFDEFFDGYSYLEDFDFSYSVSKEYKLAILADAKYWHYPSRSGRETAFKFGKTEVRNRLYVVKKQGFSIWRCYIVLMIRVAMTLGEAAVKGEMSILKRGLGNCVALGEHLVRFL